MTLEQVLKAGGMTDQELTDLGPMLANPRFRNSLEKELTNGEKALADLNEYDRWFTQEITPEHNNLLKRAADAEAEAAANKARFEAYQKSGFVKQAGVADKAAEEAARLAREEAERKNGKGGDAPDSRYVSSDTFAQAYEKTGEAIAVATNIVSSHMQLFPGQFLDMEDLRLQAKAAKKPVKEFWEAKYNVPGRRQELQQKQVAEAEAKIREDERRKVTAELASSNPGFRMPVESNNPFVLRKKAEGTKQPWERNDSDMKRERIEKAIQKAAGRGESVASA